LEEEDEEEEEEGRVEGVAPPRIVPLPEEEGREGGEDDERRSRLWSATWGKEGGREE